MKLSSRLCGAFACALLCRASGAYADAALVLDEPEAVTQSAKYRLQVLDDGFARLHLKWSSPSDNKHGVDLLLSIFKAEGQPAAIVGFDGGGEGTQPRLPYLQNVEVSAKGTEIRLATSGLASDVEYVGSISATIAKRQTLIWSITLVRPSAVAPFRCPTGPQIVNPDGLTAIDFQTTAPVKEKSVGLRLSAFTSKEQELGQVGFLAGTPGRELQYELPSYPLNGQHLVLPIRAMGLTEGITYTGRVRFVVGTREVMECSLDLLMPKLPRSELVSDSQSLTRAVTLPFGPFGHDSDMSLAVRLFEKTRARRLDGITVTLDGATESPEGAFDLNRHVSFSLNGIEVPDFTQLQLPVTDEKSRTARTLQPGEQLNVDMKLRHLSAGKYAFALRFASASATGSTPKLDVTINVRHHLACAVIAVLTALILSFFISKGIVNLRERLRVRGRVQKMRKERFDDHDDLPSVVFLRAVLDQTEQLIGRKWLLPPPPSVYDYLGRAERVVTILRRYNSLQKALDDVPFASARDFYREAIEEVMQRIGPQPLDQKTTDGVLEDFGVFAARLADPIAWYWSTLGNKAKELAQRARDVQATLGEPAVVEPLLAKLEQPLKGLDRTFADAYWIVRLLYSRRRSPDDIKELIKAYKSSQTLAETFKVADRLAWARLHDEVLNKRVTIELVRSVEEPEALRPMQFRLKFDDAALAESYFVLNVLTYKWDFELIEAPRHQLWLRVKRAFIPSYAEQPREAKRSVTLKGPRFTEYASFVGQLKVSVTICWLPADGVKAERELVDSITRDIGKNTELSLLRSVAGSEILLMGIVAAVALVTSLPTLYFAKATFGSFADYVAILAWAIGIDQGKNLIQLLKTDPADGAPTGSSP